MSYAVYLAGLSGKLREHLDKNLQKYLTQQESFLAKPKARHPLLGLLMSKPFVFIKLTKMHIPVLGLSYPEMA